MLALVLLRRDGTGARGAAEAALDAAAALIERCGGHTLEPSLCEWRAELAQVLGDGASRRRLLQEAQQRFIDIGAPELTAAMDTLEVPATVQSLLAARIDRLGEREKQVLYTAAVIGKEFARPLLEAVIEMTADDLDAALSALLAAELINEHAIYPVAEYSFKHPLTHEVALHAQLSSARRARHAAVATAIEAASPDRLDELAGLLAHHWQEAGEPLRAATWHMRAARWVRTNDMAASRRHCTQARKLLVALPEAAERTRLLLDVYPELINMMDRLGADPVESRAVFHEALQHTRSAGDRRTEALLEAEYSQPISSQSDFDSMIEHASRAIALADAEGDHDIGLLARHFLGRGYAWQARWNEAITVFDQSIAIDGGDDAAKIEVLGWRPYVESLGIRAACLSISGRVREASEFAEHFPALLRRSGIGSDVSSASSDRYWACWISGDAERARARIDASGAAGTTTRGRSRHELHGLQGCSGDPASPLSKASRIARARWLQPSCWQMPSGLRFKQ